MSYDTSSIGRGVGVGVWGYGCGRQARRIRQQRMRTAESLGWFYGSSPGSGVAFLQPLYSQKHLGMFPTM